MNTRVNIFVLTAAVVLAASWATCGADTPPADALASGFATPPDSARPWVYWFWLNGNLTREGITADLEAMKRVGIGGVLIMEVDQGAPVGPVNFMSADWRELFKHVHAEAQRLGLEVNMNNDAGWNGSGGPWITPEQSMQKVVWSETNVTGPKRFEEPLPQPETVAGFYRDISVVAFPATGSYRIDRVRAKAMYEVGGVVGIPRETVPAEMTIARDKIVTLTESMTEAGKLAWDVPPGEWTIVRFGHTSTGVENAPAPQSGRGLECDKLSKEGIEANFDAMMACLADDTGITPDGGKFGLVATHIDSWENGSQNWTTRMREEFQQRRGYDLLPLLPVLTGRVVDSLEISERFLWDLRQTVSEMVIEYYAGHMRELAHARGMRFTVEAYGSPCDSIPYAGRSDEPMGEFWTPSGAIETCKTMASAAHVYGRRIVGAEAFTSGDQEKWREHPALLKALGDRVFCEGINRFVFHRYALQPWPKERRPGMTMGPWGQHYERTQTWWEWTPVWHEYLARCQFLLRQGRFAADICYVQPEAPPQGPTDYRRAGYGWDECTAEAVLTRMSVRDGRVVLPDGMSYQLLVLSDVRVMTPRFLRKITELVQAGATVLGPRPLHSPSLSGFPDCDAEIQRLSQELWGDCDGQAVKEHASGKGRVVWGLAPEKVLQQSGLPVDFASDQPLHQIHRTCDDAELYFVANPQPYSVAPTCSFRVVGRVPEFWWPETGRTQIATMFQEQDGLMHVVVPLESGESVFVVFRDRGDHDDPIVLLTHDGKRVLSATPEPPPKITVTKAQYGVLDDPQRTRDVTERVQRKVDVYETIIPVATMAQGDDPAFGEVKTLVVDYTVEGKRFTVRGQDRDTVNLSRDAIIITVEKARYGVLGDPQRTRDVRAKVQRLADAGESSFRVARMAEGDDPAFLVVKTLDLEFTLNGQRVHITGTDPETIHLKHAAVPASPVALIRRDLDGTAVLASSEPGEYAWTFASGKTKHAAIQAAVPSIPVSGPWQVSFAPDSGAPASITFDELVSWSEHSDPGVKYYSGVATYASSLTVPSSLMATGKRLYLDLGEVQSLAQITLNGHDLGTLWKPPFRVDITSVAKPGENKLEVRVVNLWPNRMIGDEQLPEDSERNANGTLKAWPQWVMEGKPSPTGRLTFTSWRLWKKNDPLLPSGLLGPVTVQAVECIPVE